MGVSLYKASFSGLPILKSKGNLHFFEEVIMDGQYFQVAWLKDDKQNNCTALYGSQPLAVIERNADSHFIIEKRNENEYE